MTDQTAEVSRRTLLATSAAAGLAIAVRTDASAADVVAGGSSTAIRPFRVSRSAALAR